MIIGLAGYAQVGKDTAAKALIDRGFTRFAFGDILKREVNDMLYAVGITDNVYNEEKKKFWRDFLVFWGAKRRAISKDYLITQIDQDINLRNDNLVNRGVVITDVRYLNEVKWIQERGGKVIWIHRPEYPPANKEEILSFYAIRQQATDIIDLDNNGTIEELHNKIKSLDFLNPQGI